MSGESSIRALGVLYYAAVLEDARIFDVVDRLTEQFQSGVLPIGQETEAFVREWREIRESPTQDRRRDLCSAAFGFPGGSPGVSPNREFNDLWTRFVSAVSELVEDRHPPRSASQAMAAARVLAENLAAHRISADDAVAIDRQLHAANRIVSSRDVQGACRVHGTLDLVERVAEAELGSRPNVARAFGRAASGRRIVHWLANHAPAFAADPVDADLVQACERWLADTGLPEERLEELARPEPGPEVRRAVRGVFAKWPAFAALTPVEQEQMAQAMGDVGAELTDEVNFPEFVRGLIEGVFEANVKVSIEQMGAYKKLLAAVTRSLDHFRTGNLTEALARDRLVDQFPDLLTPPPAEPCDPRLHKSRYPLLARTLAAGIARLAGISGATSPSV